MKHIFKKLHKSHHHHNEPGRINQTLGPSPATPSSSAQSQSSDHGPSPTSQSATPEVPASISGGGVGVSTGVEVDFLSSEEEFQMQLALAISASNSELRDDPENDQIREATLLSLRKPSSVDCFEDEDVSGEILSQRYWDFAVLDFEEKVVDGFYDVYSISMDPATKGKMPSLAELEMNPGDFGFEAVIVNRTIDPMLQELEQVAHCIAIDCPPSSIRLFVQRLAELVTDHMGGRVKDASIMLARWVDRSTELRTSLQTSVFPIGSVTPGISRHRALLFKVLADYFGIRCRLMKGSHYTGIENEAVNIIKLDERDFLVDLMEAPGTLIPADELNTKHFSSQSGNKMLNKVPYQQVLNGCSVMIPKTKEMLGNNAANRGSENKMQFHPNLGSGQAESSSTSVKDEAGAGPSSCKSNHPKQFDFPSTSAVGSSLCKANRGALATSDGMRMNVNVPHNQGNFDETTNPFADLNPFHMRGADRLVQNKPQEYKIDESQRQRNDSISGRPPLPKMWKNHHAINEALSKKEFQGLFPRNSCDTNYSNMSAASSSSFSKNSIPHISKTTDEPSLTCIYKDTGNSKDGIALVAATNRNTNCRMSLIDAGRTYADNETIGSEVTSSMKMSSRQQGQNNDEIIELHGYPKCILDGITETELLHDDTGILTSPINSSTGSVDPVFEDVGGYEIMWEDLAVGERIGFGSYGEVFLADMNGTEVAVKKFLDQDFLGAALDEFKSEVRIMRRLHHPNVVLFMGAVTRSPNLSIITEYLPRGSLYHLIHHPHSQIDEEHRLRMALDVARGMNCLHTSTPTIVHRDLKSPNLLVDNNWSVKVCDFGLSRLKQNTFLSSKSTAGTPEWMAPEVLRNEPSNEKCDVFSFGVILWELATLKRPWSAMNPMQVVGEVGFKNTRLEIPKEVDPLVARIIWECWQTNPDLRPSFAQLCVALKPLQHLILPATFTDQQTPPMHKEISVNFAP